MKQKIAIISSLVVSGGIALLAATAPVAALDATIGGGAEAARGADQPADLFGSAGVLSTITNVLLFIIGAVSVIMIIIGGLRYILSGGDSSNVSAAKNTILYAIVGIIVALLAYAIVNFVLGALLDGTGGGGGMSSGGGATNF